MPSPSPHRSTEDQLEELTRAMRDVAAVLPTLQRGAQDPEGDTYRRRSSDTPTLLKLVVPVLLALVIGFSGWMFSRIQDHGDRITVIENTRLPPATREALSAGMTILSTQMIEVQRRLQNMENAMVSMQNTLNRRGATP